jgi:hypothetical protein
VLFLTVNTKYTVNARFVAAFEICPAIDELRAVFIELSTFAKERNGQNRTRL